MTMGKNRITLYRPEVEITTNCVFIAKIVVFFRFLSAIKIINIKLGLTGITKKHAVYTMQLLVLPKITFIRRAKNAD